MAEFICRLGTPSGEMMTRIVEANAANEARARLEGEGFRVFKISSAESGLSAMMPFGTGKKTRVKPGDFLIFNQQLSALLRAGIPILQSISLLKARSGSSTLRTTLADVEEKIKSGVPLSEAFEAQGIFPRIYTASILAGERAARSTMFWRAMSIICAAASALRESFAARSPIRLFCCWRRLLWSCS